MHFKASFFKFGGYHFKQQSQTLDYSFKQILALLPCVNLWQRQTQPASQPQSSFFGFFFAPSSQFHSKLSFYFTIWVLAK